jgi:hypothetical protein
MTSPVAPPSGDPAAASTIPTGSAPATSAPAPTTATAPAKPIKLAADTAKALKAALAAEQVAVWGYDLVAGYDPADADLIAVIRAGHLARAQATANLLVAGGSTAPGPAPSYALPNPVTDVTSARALAATIEGDCAAAWHGVIGATDNTTIRNVALAGLSDSAVWLTSLKLAGKISPATVPFPGQP